VKEERNVEKDISKGECCSSLLKAYIASTKQLINANMTIMLISLGWLIFGIPSARVTGDFTSVWLIAVLASMLWFLCISQIRRGYMVLGRCGSKEK